MTQQLSKRLITAEEFEQMPEFDYRYELVEGRLAKKPMPSGRKVQWLKFFGF